MTTDSFALGNTATLEYEFDEIDAVAVALRGYSVAFEAFMDVYERNRRLYGFESHRQAVEAYPAIFRDSYGTVIAFKRKLERAIEQYRLSPVDQRVNWRHSVGNLFCGDDHSLEGVK